MPKVALTDRFVAGVKADEGQIDYFDSKTRGLVLRVSATGVKTWCVFYTSPKDGKRARTTIGRYPQTALSDARTRALDAKTSLDQGADPRDVATAAMTVRQLADSYLAKHVRPKLRTWKAIERRLQKNVLPVIGGTAVADLHKRDVNRVVDKLLDHAPIEAARVYEDLRAMLRWAVRRGDLDHSPMDGMRTPATSQARERVLSDEELRVLWKALPEALPRSRAVQRIIKLCLLTAQRVGEVAGMCRGELDLDKRIWTIPAARSKNKHAHTAPLTDAAVAVIAEALNGEHLFPGDNGTGSLPGHAIAKTIRKAQERFGISHWTAHDLRRTACTRMAELGVSPIVLGHVINHRSTTKAGVTLAHYVQYDYAAEKRDALELWANRLTGIVSGGAKVVPMRGRA